METIQISLNDLSSYDGETNQNGERHGKGKCFWIDGSEYDGEWINNKKEGLGKYTRKDKYSYSGYWKQNLKHG